MVHAVRSKILAILLLCFCINIVVADRWGVHIHRRDGPTTPSITSTETSLSPSSTSTSSQTGGDSSGDSEGQSKTDKTSDETSSDQPKSTTTSVTTTDASSSSDSTASASASSTTNASAVTSNLVGAAPTATINNSSIFNCMQNYDFNLYVATATPEKLPLAPQLTPGFGVAGAILLISGAVYTVIGIKNKMLHVFLSAGYLASLAVSVLILYVMNLPVSNAVQGAYVVAAVMTGLVIGGGAIVFSEMTEGLGSLLGGFCFSMWLLVLKPGGLLTSTSGKSIFIAVFTVVSFATSFHRYTRPYSLMALISFGGATVVVIGIDCFSRAGLKEFWAYIWDLNNNLFPVGATTYPLTRGIKVEIAAIIVIFLAGIVSQMKLWKVIKERREERAVKRLADERTMAKEEENAGRRIEDLNAEERHQWEAVHGDKDHIIKDINLSQRDSGVGDMDSQNKGAMSVVTSIRRSADDQIEMSEMVTPTTANGAGLVMSRSGQDGGAVTVRVARDLEPEPELDENGNPVEPVQTRRSHASARSSLQLDSEEENVWVVGADGEARFERRPSRRHSPKRNSNPPISTRASGAPEVVPLPFKVPEGDVEDDRSSVATFADDEQAGHQDQKRQSKRLSTGSAILHRFSKRSQRNSSRLSNRVSIGEASSTEDLVIPRGIEDDRASSIAATVDGLSDDEGMRSIRSSIDLAPDTSEARSPNLDNLPMSVLSPPSNPDGAISAAASVLQDTEGNSKRAILAESIEKEGEKAGPEGQHEENVTGQSLTRSTDPKPESKAASTIETPEPSLAEKPKTATSVVSAAESKSAAITKETLPPQMSRVVMSYRTNEWAKHLGNADVPEVEELKIEKSPSEDKITEVAAPVMVAELQQTPENALPPPASRITSTMSNHNAPPLIRSSSAQSKAYPAPYQSRPETANGFVGQDSAIQRSMSQQSKHSQTSQTNLNRFRTSSSPAIPQAIVESPIEENFPSQSVPGMNQVPINAVPFGSSDTLIGKRDTMMRNKSYSFHNSQTALASTPELPTAHDSMPQSRAGSESGSLNNSQNTSIPILPEDDDNMSLSARRNLIRQSSLQQLSSPVAPLQQPSMPYDSHQPRRQSSVPSHMAREQQLASWRASVQHDLHSAVVPKMSVERQRSALWQERQAEEQRKAMDARMKGERNNAFDERMRRGDMLSAHRDALRKMQAGANKHA
ncbi:hypothetical protein LHYA1_G008287 [Lachnellula hyalina]|uniref:TM7S3/TM198-like domain-containing protein n=1 Tax=Lachnellula hyalina TaxID=1316788 RepID=A0A8H8QVJ7_9HELO|nr:uncharacterized protein LHYA1_G008287 [Lachnellula hyalina]TVY23558.1 hypothetical protein LHYA1_G008287 [Lachnellula hyalina]